MRKIFSFVLALILVMGFVGCAAKPAEDSSEVKQNDPGAEESLWLEKSEWPTMLVDVDKIVVTNLAEYDCNTGYDGEIYYCVISNFDFTYSQTAMAGLDDEVVNITNAIYEAAGVKATFFFYNSAGDVVLAVYDGADITSSLS